MNNQLRRTVAALALMWVCAAALAAPVLSIDPNSYQLISSRQVDRTIFEYSYTAEIVNTGTAAVNVSASVGSTAAVTTIVEGVANFGSVPAGARVRSSDTFTIRHDRRVAFNRNVLTWQIAFQDAPNVPPVANAGADQVVFEGQVVTLNGTASTDADGNPLTYRWSLVTRPAGSAAVLSNPNAATTSFEADLPGLYEARLIVNDGVVDSAPDLVSIQTNQANVAPVANAGADSGVLLGTLVQLDGTASFDANGDELAFIWTFLSRPPGSSAVLSDESSPMPTFVPDAVGDFVVALVVDDGLTSSEPDTVTITTSTPNSAPVTHAGPDQSVEVGAVVTLSGAASSDADGDPLSYSWTILNQPAGSTATLAADNTVAPSFVADRVGQFIVQLIVSDGQGSGEPDTVVVTVGPGNSPPVANAGPDQAATVGEPVVLNGNGSTDPDDDPLSYDWSLTTRPPGSAAELNTENLPVVTFTPDLEGLYVAQLQVNDGTETSAADTANITAEAPPNHPPVANPDTAVTDEGVAVQIDVLANDSDQDGDTLTVVSASQGAHGDTVVIANGVRYTPRAGFTGTDTFAYTVSDGEDTATALIVVTVNEVALPVVAVDDFASTPEESPVTIAVLANDTGGGSPLRIASITQSPRGTASIVGNTLVFVPTQDFNGQATFSYVATDDVTSDAATVTVNITPVNDAPVALGDFASTVRQVPVTIQVLANDSDIDLDALGIVSVSPATHGTATIVGNAIRYQSSNPGYIGTDQFSYVITDGAITASASVIVDIRAQVLPGPIAYYRLDQNGIEAMGRNPNLGPLGTPVFSAAMNPGLGTALDLDGVDDALIANGFTPSQTGNLSISAWVLARSTAEWASIVKNWAGGGHQFHFGLDESGRFLENWVQTGAGQFQVINAGNNFPLGTWTHVALVVEAVPRQQHLYINGTRVATATFPAPMNAIGISPLAIGTKPNAIGNGPEIPGWQFWNGLIDDVAIWDVSLSAAEIARVRQAGLDGIPVAPLVGLPLDTTPPVITPVVNGVPGNAGWYVSGVEVTWNVADAHSSIQSSSGCERVYVIEDTAGRTLTCSATSAGGTATQSVTIRKDASAPAVTFPTPAPGATYVQGQDVRARFECNDVGSGSASCSGTLDDGVAIDTAALGAQSFEVTATDQAGNTHTFTRSYTVVAQGANVISTIAGGGPIDSVNALGTGLGMPRSNFHGVAVDGRGNTFIASAGQNQIFKVDPSGFLTVVAGNGSSISSGDGGAAVSAGIADPQGVVVDSAGNLYIAEASGSRIRRVDAASGVITTIAGTGIPGFSGDGGLATNANISLPTGIALDAAGNLYFGDRNNHRIRRIDALTRVITTIAGNGTQGFAGDGGLATAAQIDGPNGVAVDGSGNVYFADTRNNRIRRIESGTLIISTVAGGGTAAPGSNGPATGVSLATPFAISMDRDNNLIIAEYHGYRIRRVDAGTGVISTIAGNGVIGDSGDGGLATTATMYLPNGLAADAAGRIVLVSHARLMYPVIRRIEGSPGIISRIAGSGEATHGGHASPAPSVALSKSFVDGLASDVAGNLYIADSGANRLRKFNASTGEITNVAGNGTQGFSGDGGPAASAALRNPRAVALDDAGNVFIADSDNRRIRRIDALTGSISTFAGSGEYGFSGDGGPALLARFTDVFGIAVDSQRNVYFTDAFNSRVRKIDGVTGIISTVAGDGTNVHSGDGGPATAAGLRDLRDIVVDAAGNLYITTQFRVRRVDAVTGVITTVAGNGNAGSFGDGGPAVLGGTIPAGLAVRGGSIYISEFERIRRVTPDGIINTVVGTAGTFGFAGDGGVPTAARLHRPKALALDARGNLYFSDSENGRIRRVGPAGGVVDTTPPEISLNVAGIHRNGWYLGDVAVTWTVSDPESAISSTSGCEATQITADTTGVTLTCTATSAGGTSEESTTRRRDATPPAVNVIVPAEGSAYQQGEVVLAQYDCIDATSGSLSCVGTVAAGAAIDTATAGPKTFTVTGTDGAGNIATVTRNYSVSVAIPPVTAVADAATTPEDQPVTIAVLANDTGGGAPLSITAVTQGVHGTVSVVGNNVLYTPAADYHGGDTFTYTASDGDTSSSAAVTVTVTGVNDPPVANDDLASTDEDVVAIIPVLANDTDVDGDVLTISAVTPAVLGTVVINGSTLVFTPNPDVSGSEVITYTASDGEASDTATVTITINAVNDRPVANDDISGITAGDSVLIAVLANDTDVENSPLSVVSVTQPANGVVTTNGSTVTYTAPAGFVGAATFSYSASDGDLADDATVTVNVTSNPPIAVATPDEGDAIDFDVLQLVGSGSSDVDNDVLSYHWEIVEAPALSNAVISDASAANPTVSPVRAGRYVFRLTVSDGYVSVSDLASYNVTNAPVISIEDVEVMEGDSGNVNAVFTVSLSSTINRPVTVNYLATPGTATLGSDFEAVEGSLTFPPNSNTPQTITVVVRGDAVYEPDEFFTVTLSQAVNASVLDSQARGTIRNDDPDPAFAITFMPAVVNIETYSSQQITVQLGSPAPAGGVTINLTSASPSVATPTSSVFVGGGNTSATATITTGDTAGNVLVTANAAGYNTGSVEIVVANRAANVQLSTSLVGVGRTIGGQIVLERAAPAGGITFSLASNLPGVAQPSPTVVTVAGGQTAANFNVNGVAQGAATIQATAPGYSVAGANVTTTHNIVTIAAIPDIGPGQNLSLNLALSQPAVETVVVALSSSDPSIASVTPFVTIEAGATTPTVNPVVTGQGIGTTQITAVGAGFAGHSTSVRVTLSLSLTPANVSVAATRSQNITLQLSTPAPAGGLLVNLASDNPAIATLLPATVTVPAGQLVAQLQVQGVAQGSTTVRASAPGVAAASASVTVGPAPRIFYCVNGGCSQQSGLTVRVGEDLQFNLRGYFEEAPPTPTTMTATLGSGAVAAVSTLETAAGAPAASQPNITATSGSLTAAQFWVQGLAQGGTTTLTLSAPGYADMALNIAVDPSGFVWQSTNHFTTNTSAVNTTLTLGAVRLNPGNLVYAGAQEIRGGLIVSVPVTSSIPTVGTITTSPVVMQAVADNDPNSQYTTQFDPVGGGTTNLVVGVPAGFDAAPLDAGNNQFDRTLVVTVNAPAILMCTNGSCGQRTGATARIGEDLQINLRGYFEEAPQSPLTVTATVASGSVALVSAVENLAGSNVAIDENITAISGSAQAAQFWVQGLTQGSSTTVTLSAPGFADAVLNVVVDPSGMVWVGPTSNITTNTSAPNTTFTLSAVRLNAGTLTYAGQQEIRGGLSVSVPITSSVPSVGTITTTPLLMQALADTDNVTSVTTQFDPVGAGTTHVVAEVPAGFDAAPLELGAASFDRTVVATVTAPAIIMCFNSSCGFRTGASVRVGEDLQINLRAYLEEAPPAPLTITATSASGAVAVVSGIETAPGGLTATDDNISAVSGSLLAAQFWLQGLAQGGTTTVTLSAPGYADAVLNVAVDPSGVVIQSPASNFTTNTSAPNNTITLSAARLNAGTLTFAAHQEVRAGLIVNVPVTSSVPTVGSITTSPVVMQTIADNETTSLFTTQFDPSGGGVTNIVVGVPAGFDAAPLDLGNNAFDRTLVATVNAPAILMCTNGSCGQASGSSVRVGEDLQVNLRAYLQEAPPAPVTVTATVASGAIAAISGIENAAGGIVATDSNITAISGSLLAAQFWLQGLTQGGSTTVTFSAPGYSDAVMNVAVDPSGVVFVSPTSNFTTNSAAANTSLMVGAVRLNAGSLTFAAHQEVRGGVTVSVPITSSSPPVGTITTSPLLLQAVADNLNTTQLDTQFDPAGAGTSNLVVGVPAGFDAAPLELGNNQFDRTLVATVNSPAIVMCINTSCGQQSGISTQVGEDLQFFLRAYLQEAPAAPVAITATSSDGSMLVVAQTETTVGLPDATDENITATTPSAAAAQFWIQALSRGTTTITLSAPGYATSTLNVRVDPSGFVIVNSDFQIASSASNSTLILYASRLDPVSLAAIQRQELRGGITVPVQVTSSIPGVGAITTSPVFVQAVADGNVSEAARTQFDPVSAGTTQVEAVPAAGFDTPAIVSSGDDRFVIATVLAN